MPLQSDVRRDHSFGRIVQKRYSRLEEEGWQNEGGYDALEVSFVGLNIL